MLYAETRKEVEGYLLVYITFYSLESANACSLPKNAQFFLCFLMGITCLNGNFRWRNALYGSFPDWNNEKKNLQLVTKVNAAMLIISSLHTMPLLVICLGTFDLWGSRRFDALNILINFNIKKYGFLSSIYSNWTSSIYILKPCGSPMTNQQKKTYVLLIS